MTSWPSRIVAVFYTGGIAVLPLLGALVPIAVFAVLVQCRVRSWWALAPLGVIAWALVHASGIHATIAGVLLGFTVPAIATARAGFTRPDNERIPLAERFAERWSRFSSGVAVPVFAFFSAGVTVGGLTGLGASFRDFIVIGIMAALVLGKAIGIIATSFMMSRLPGISMDPSIRWPDQIGMAFVAGIGFTVSLLVAERAFGVGTPADDHAKVGVLTGSLCAAVIGGTILALRSRHYCGENRSTHPRLPSSGATR